MVVDLYSQDLTDTLTHRCEVHEPTEAGTTRTGHPGKTHAQASGEDERACFLESVKFKEIRTEDKRIIEADWRLYVASDLVVTEQHRIVNIDLSSDQSAPDGKTYEIKYVATFTDLGDNDQAGHKELYLAEIT